MAARLAGDNVRRMHQSLHHVVADAPWSDEAVLDRCLDSVIPAMLRRDPVVAATCSVFRATDQYRQPSDRRSAVYGSGPRRFSSATRQPGQGLRDGKCSRDGQKGFRRPRTPPGQWF